MDATKQPQLASSDSQQDKLTSIRVIYDTNTKFKHLIENPSQTFGELKSKLLKRAAAIIGGDSITEDALYSICDDQDFQFGEDDSIENQLAQNDTVKILRRQSDQQQQPIIVPVAQLNAEQQQQQQQQQPSEQVPAAEVMSSQMEVEEEKQEDPTEAIVVLYDVSGSMQSNFFDDKELSRMGAVNALFSAFADKTLAFEYNHLVQLFLFQSQIHQQCEFISDMNQFINLVDGARPGGGTRLYDSLDRAVTSLLEIKKKYPEITLRIIALTDGEDNESRKKPEEIAREIVRHRIVLDSFVVSEQSQGLKTITHASGGRCYCPKDLYAGMKLFEIETILSVRARDLPTDERDPDTINLKDFESKPFDTDGIVARTAVQKNHEGGNVEDILKKYKDLSNAANSSSSTTSCTTSTASTSTQSADLQNQGLAIKRLIRELELVNTQSSTFKAKVFPEASNIQKWKVLLIGPEGTSYSKGVFVVYLTFPNNYPMRAPTFRFITPLYHPNITSSGQVCLDTLLDNWQPSFTCINMINSISQLLAEPNQAYAVESNIAAEMNHERELYNTKCLEHVNTHARQSVEELLREVLGVSVDVTTETYKKAHEDLTAWIALNRP